MAEKTIPARFSHLEFNKDIKAVIEKHKNLITPVEMLALAAHLTGQLIALQDQNTVTSKMAMKMVAKNIEVGNREAIAGLLASKATV